MAIKGLGMRTTVMAMVVVMAALIWPGARAQTGCTSAIASLSPCLGFVTGNTSTPSSSCCTQLASIVTSQVRCLCTVLNGSAATAIGLPINQTQAIALPGACNLQTPPISQCNAMVGAPAGAPSESPSTTTPSTTTPSESPSTSPPSTTTPSVPSGSGSKSVPNKATTTSAAGGSNLLPVPLFFFMLFFASYASTLSGSAF